MPESLHYVRHLFLLWSGAVDTHICCNASCRLSPLFFYLVDLTEWKVARKGVYGCHDSKQFFAHCLLRQRLEHPWYVMSEGSLRQVIASCSFNWVLFGVGDQWYSCLIRNDNCAVGCLFCLRWDERSEMATNVVVQQKEFACLTFHPLKGWCHIYNF